MKSITKDLQIIKKLVDDIDPANTLHEDLCDLKEKLLARIELISEKIKNEN